MDIVKRRLNRTSAVLLLVGLLSTVSFAAESSGYYTLMAVQVNKAGNVVFRLNDDLDNVWYVCETDKQLHLAVLLTALSTRREVDVYWTGYSGGRTDRKVSALRIH